MVKVTGDHPLARIALTQLPLPISKPSRAFGFGFLSIIMRLSFLYVSLSNVNNLIKAFAESEEDGRNLCTLPTEKIET